MQTKTIYEEEMLKDIQDLPENLQKKLTRIVHFLKKEILISDSDEKTITNNLLAVCGTWEDERSPEQQIMDIQLSRRSKSEKENLF